MINNRLKTFLFLLSVGFIFLSQSCRRDVFYNDPGAKLSFSEDTVQFDTVFTTVGSITLPLTIFNNYNNPILISEISLAGGEPSQFRINVDGDPGTVFHDIEIPANDSLYLFIEVTVDPNNDALPYVIEDSVMFELNGNIQTVNLVAWGQNAHFHYSEIVCDEIWFDDLPHVVYGYVYVDTGCSLTIDRGCNIFVHGGASIIAQGALKINGEADSVVTIQGDRLEDFYKDLPGQWNGIYILRNSVGSSIKNTRIFNSIDGISMGGKLDDEFTQDDLPDYLIEQPELEIINTMIYDNQNYGIFAINAKIDATNLLIYNIGLNNLALLCGGDYNFKYCTIVGYSSEFLTHQNATIGFQDYIAFAPSADWTIQEDLTNANFTNCIIEGSLPEKNEIAIDTLGDVTVFNYLFDHCMLRTDIDQDILNDNACIFNSNPVFENASERKFNIVDGSPALDAAVDIGIDFDILNLLRPIGIGFDIGAYEKQ